LDFYFLLCNYLLAKSLARPAEVYANDKTPDDFFPSAIFYPRNAVMKSGAEQSIGKRLNNFKFLFHFDFDLNL